MKVIVYRLRDGTLTLSHVEGAATIEAIEADLADGFRVGEGLGGSSIIRIFGPPGTLGMTAAVAIKAGVLTIPLTK
jgi:hypothetical protein